MLQDSYPIGQIDPYSILMIPNSPSATILSAEYFTLETNLVYSLLNTSRGIIDAKSVSALSFCLGHPVSYELAEQYHNASSALYGTSAAANYRGATSVLLNSAKTATRIKLITLVDPHSESIVSFIVDTRNTLRSFSSNPANTLNGESLSAYLFGGKTTTYDLQEIVYGLVPVMVGTTVAAVLILIGISFGSIALTVRLVVTVSMSLCWAYGFMVVVYQRGPGQDAFMHLTPSLENSAGIYWLIPIMSFSILVGLALDYDIFLMSRMVEYR